MAFEEYPCVKQVICALEAPLLTALDNVLILLIAETAAQLASVTAALAALDITVLPVNVALNATQAVLDQFRTTFALLPVGAVSGCARLGELMDAVNDVSNQATADIRAFRTDATRLLSTQDELLDAQARLTQLSTDFQGLRDVIGECLVESI